ncbi:MAG: hypothetical protein U0269_19715 [Polyangiales bacterium]
MALSKNAETMLGLIPEDGRIGGQTLWRALEGRGVDAKAAAAAEAELLAANKIAIGRGQGGSYRRVVGDEERFMRLLDVSGAMRTNAEVRAELGLDGDHDKYWLLLRSLIEQGLVRVGRGRGGKVGRVIKDSAEESSVAAPIIPSSPSASTTDAGQANSPTTIESSWYPFVERGLRGDWSKSRGFDEVLVAATHSLGSKKTGGRWTRPDLLVLSKQRFRLPPSVVFESHSFEVKPPGQWTVLGAHEASAHGRYFTRPYLLLGSLILEDDLVEDDRRALDACYDECARLGVGLVVVYPGFGFDDWDWLLEPQRHTPAPEDVESALANVLTSEEQQLIEAWGRV